MSKLDNFRLAGHVVNLRTMEFQDFVDQGFLQELNRQFLHPLGLALSVRLDKNSVKQCGDIQDYRNDPEGIVFDKEYICSQECRDKADAIATERSRHIAHRTALLGSMIQRIPPITDPVAAAAVACGPACDCIEAVA